MTTGSVASAWNNPDARVLVVAPNWLGDGVMALPALQTLRERIHPDAALHVAARPGQAPLWRMSAVVDQVVETASDLRNLRHTAFRLSEGGYTHAFLIPHSFRSALAPRLAGIPRRRGTRRQAGRRFLINDPVRLENPDPQHQQWEVARLLLGEPPPPALPPPRLTPGPRADAEADAWLGDVPGPRLALIPGAARGPSKQWPAERFRAVAEGWIAETGGGAVWLGGPGDAALCAEASKGLTGISLAGATSLEQFAAVLAGVDAAVVNDSGGMHLAAAMGAPLVAVFGITDPAKTGPLSPRAVVVQHSRRRDRRVPRDCPEARTALEAVAASEVLERVLAFPRRSR